MLAIISQKIETIETIRIAEFPVEFSLHGYT